MAFSDQRERGNILFLILLAVVLFAALSYAVTSSMRGGGNNASKESEQAQIAQIYNMINLQENTVQRMVLGGVAKEQLDFSATNVVYNGTNSNCSTNACKVFSQSGGSIPAIGLPISMSSPAFTAASLNTAGELQIQYRIASIKDVGSSLPDLYGLVTGLSQSICAAINVKEGVMNAGDSILQDTEGNGGTGFVWASGTSSSPWPTGLTANSIGDQDPRLATKRVSCTYASSTQGYSLRFVLLAL